MPSGNIPRHKPDKINEKQRTGQSYEMKEDDEKPNYDNNL